MLPPDRWGVLELTPELAQEWAALTESVQGGELVNRPDYAGTTFYPEFEESPLVPLEGLIVMDEGFFDDVFKSPIEIDGIRANPLYRSAPIKPFEAKSKSNDRMDVDECRLEVRAKNVLRIIVWVQEHQFSLELTPKFLREILPASDNAKPPPEPERDPMYDEYLAMMAEQGKQG